jgi:hypothetical protein
MLLPLVAVSSGVPLLPGALRPGQEGAVRVTVNGVEQAAYVAGLHSLHTDGSLRAVLIQFQLASLDAAAPKADTGTISIGTTRDAAFVVAAPLVQPGGAPGAPPGVPQAAALPYDPNYLVATDLVGATMTSAQTAALGGAFAKYENDFASWAEKHWARDGAGWVNANYYDRALIYYAFWARTGNPTYWSRAAQLVYDYRTKYLEPNAYGSSAHWAQLEGVEKHYLLTGDTASRYAVIKTADVLNRANAENFASYQTRSKGDTRVSARTLHSALLAWRLSPPGSPTVRVQSQVSWTKRLDNRIAEQFAWQEADGSFPSDWFVCGGQLNYMVGQLNDALIKTWEYYNQDPRIERIVTRSVDHLWSTQWLTAKNAFQYASVDCQLNLAGFGVGSPSPSGDLNNMIVAGFGWAFRRTGNTAYRDAGEQIFAAGVGWAYVGGQKQFNEEYTSSFRYLGYR